MLLSNSQKPQDVKLGRGVRQQDRAAVVIVLVAVLLVVVMMFCGFAIDLAHMMQARTELRAAADLSAKAAAGELSRSQDINIAKDAAKQVAFANRVIGTQLTLEDQDIVFGHSDRQSSGAWAFQPGVDPFNSVRVNARRVNGSADGSVALFFGKFYNKEDYQTQASATATFMDVDICLVLDRSSSMKLTIASTSGGMSTSDPRFCEAPHADSRWVALDNAVDLFTDYLGGNYAQEQIGVVTFSSDYNSKCGEQNLAATVDQDLTTNLGLVDAAMSTRSNTVWNGATDIAAGINLGRIVLTGPSSREYATQVMIVLTDGRYTAANPVPQAAAAAAEDIFVHTITFSNGANQTDMQEVADVGGGNHFHAPDAEALEDVFEQIAGSIAILTE